eukprot:901718-Pleurochrysis_carterae.AAC.2
MTEGNICQFGQTSFARCDVFAVFEEGAHPRRHTKHRSITKYSLRAVYSGAHRRRARLRR